MTNNQFIDKLAYIYLKDNAILMTRSKNNNTFYIPGGKREVGESDIEALQREIDEELSTTLKPQTIKLYGVFEAQAHGKPPGTIVRMTCYTGTPLSDFKISSEIEEMAYYNYLQKNLVGPVDQLIFDDLYKKGFLK